MPIKKSQNAQPFFHHHHPPPASGAERRVSSSGARTLSAKESAWYSFFEGAILYVMCIFLPTFLGVALRFYENSWNGHSGSQQPPDSLADVPTASNWLFIKSYACGSTYSLFSGTSFCTSGTDSGRGGGAAGASRSETTSYDSMSGVVHLQLTDVELVVLLSFALATIRILLVHALVPQYLAPRRFEALMRCKSSHMLSSYAMAVRSPVSRGGKTIMTTSGADSAVKARTVAHGDLASLVMPSFTGEAAPRSTESSLTSSPSPGPLKRVPSWTEVGMASVRRSLGHESMSEPYGGAGGHTLPLDESDTKRLFSAPRHATAVFRLGYCIASSLAAFLMFRTAEFWPVYLGGGASGRTRHCWDLSGNVFLLTGMDSDFDHRNAVLRYYFIIQGSYHLHSLCFQLLSLMLLLLQGSGGGAGKGQRRASSKLVSMKSSMRSYLRPLAEHVIGVSLISFAFLFSGLRRLGAVGMFTMDVSGVFLHLLQVCMCAPEQSWMRRDRVVKFVYWGLVIPSFMYCRFFVLPSVVWYSVAFESRDWFNQIERVLMPGAGLLLHLFFNGIFLIIQVLNCVYFGRLLRHPQLQELLVSGKDGGDNMGLRQYSSARQ